MQQIFNSTTGISLREIFPDARMFGGDDFRVQSCSSNWQSCRPGDLYAAILGPDDDGHDQAHQAIRRGASAVLAERLLPVSVPVCVVDDTREAYGRVCQELVGRPSQAMRTVGVTGTNGKTTTAALIASVFQAADWPLASTSSLGRFDGMDVRPAGQTTPTPAELADFLARSLANGCSHAVLEVSSTALAQRRLAGVELDAAVLTNARRDHLDYHGSVLNYRKAKARLFEHLKPGGFVVINADDPASEFFLSKLDQPVLTIGMRRPAELTATIVERHLSEQTFVLTAGNESVPVRTQMIGDHHVYNCLVAAGVGLVMGMDLATVVRGLESLDKLPGRMERIECGQPFGVFVDNGRTPDRLANALKALRRVTRGRLICVFGAEEHGDANNRPLLGRAAERHADVAIIASCGAGTEEPLSMAHDILDGYDRPAKARVMPNRINAVHWALEQARLGDTVLIAGLGNRTYQIDSEPGRLFDDRQLARDWLYTVGAEIDYTSSAARRRTGGVHVKSHVN